MDKKIEITVMGGVVVDVDNLPKDYTYQVIDLDDYSKDIIIDDRTDIVLKNLKKEKNDR
jgi:hypothetical protein|tara:strand:- start:202 stop:378 length:177 start_codon:yes stop_codon:yes gene_type:complete